MLLKTTRIFEENYNTTKKININRGGTRSSKTYSLLQIFALWLMNGNIGKKYWDKGVITIIRKYGSNLKSTVQRDFDEILSDWNVMSLIGINKSDRTYRYGKRLIEFKGADDSQKLKGGKRDILYCNEANELNYKGEFFQLLIRTKDLVFIDFNPDDEDIRINTELEQKRSIEKKDVNVVVSTYEDNPFLSPAEVYEIENIKDIDPQLREVYGKGGYGKITGLVFPNVEIIKEVPKESNSKGYGMDFGYTNDPTTLIQIYTWDNSIIFDELLYEHGLMNDWADEKDKDRSITGKLEWLEIGKSEQIFGDSAEPKSIDEIHRRGYNIKPVVKGPDSVEYGIESMKGYKIYVTERSVNLRKEFRKYKWSVDKNGKTLNKPIDKFNHCIDAARYVTMMTMKVKKKGKFFISSI